MRRYPVVFLSICLFVAATRDAAAEHCCLTGHVSAGAVNATAAKLKLIYHAGGMLAVSSEIQNCYDTVSTPSAKSQCMLFDIASYRLDQGMQVLFTSRGMNPEPATALLTPKAFLARMQIYSGELFGSERAAVAFFGNAPNQVITLSTQ